ncbi:MAG: hypothetical protein A3D67_00225 [Candidatus Lloydbacteria bacterium RIFCSPHIGHO2_02_FULL_51_22]|uniref:Uncharacterized protein n=3 Tax=Candidatus Lloydiibacteriota TaxID=1817910 RepID=A0A1G2DD68_9BACT|nr:MAG: hypothetical protein A3D67_00225 [Candidatus Lloydbacteria bacterium RIFCSPHIGHO2_02_FULL_51_22]OGZ15714.1 MAG: hypothetical protein A3J08_02505 [Candidatus Lloydbacteria bacterium RIFCSPLOWO2_02_FULL_51_11]OGZ16166.1 MAG: hypothetical protein A3G11_03065 [Candidatus Lloydbacteria bacterium RIFCSPLOWO2_12_FULL_51_9]
MLHHIKKLHGHPEHIRERIAVGVALGISVVIFLVWISTLSMRSAFQIDFNDEDALAGVGAAGTEGLTIVGEEAPSPSAIIKEKVGDVYKDFREAVGY